MKHLIKLPLLILIFFNISPVSASTIIDSFNDSVAQIVAANGSNTVFTTSALGGFRTVEITKFGPLGASAAVLGGSYNHSADAQTSAVSKITWDGNGFGLGGIDLLATDDLSFAGSFCFECFVLEIFDIDQGNVDLTVEVFDGVNSSSFTSIGAGIGSHEILFSEFSGIDLTSIERISLEVAGGVASDLVLDFQGYTGTAAVPLPATLWLFISGFLSFYVANRKRVRFSIAE